MITDNMIVQSENTWLAANKPPGMPTVPDKTQDLSLIELLSNKQGRKLYPVHRIDRPVSGLVVFGSGKKGASFFSEAFRNKRVKRLYLAVVASRPEGDTLNLNGWIARARSQNRSVFSPEEKKGAKKAAASIKYLDSIENYHLLGLVLESGRHHQLRAMLHYLGCPVKGDVKYGARRKNKDRSIHLHAWKLLLPDPSRPEEIIELTADIPEEVVWRAFDLEKAASLIANWPEWK